MVAVQEAYQHAGPLLPTIACGDCNARTADKQSCGPKRASQDIKSDPRGIYILETLKSAGMSLVNGTEVGGPTSGYMTSYQGTGSSVIDYCAVSQSSLDGVLGLHVNKSMLGWADHAPLELTMVPGFISGARGTDLGERSFAGYDDPPIPERERTAIDDVLDAVLASAQDDTAALRDLYGPVLADTKEVRVWTDGSATDGDQPKAGAGVWWGDNSSRNLSARVNAEQKNGRAELLALALALSAADPNRTLRVYTDSTYVIGTFGKWAARGAGSGWKGKANADIIRNVVRLISERPCPTHLSWVKAHKGNHGNEEADRLAKEGADLPLDSAVDGATLQLLNPVLVTEGRELNIPKVTAEMPKEEVLKLLEDVDGAEDDTDAESDTDTAGDEELSKNQKRRRRVKEAKLAHRTKLVNAASEAEFWRLFRKYANAPSPPPLLLAEQLRPVFDVRMNTPAVTQRAGEDPTHRARIHALAALISEYTIDTTPERFFSRSWKTGDMEDLKAELGTQKDGSATGWDDQSYAYVTTIPNERLLDLFNLALYTTRVPGMWLTTLLAGVLKRGKAGDVPENYRTIGLECTLLKMLTLLIDKRVREWAEARKLLPPTQNGFRPGYRTNNNAFILRCAAERAAAQGKTLSQEANPVTGWIHPSK